MGTKTDTSFTGILGKSPRVKIWEFLLLGRGFEYHITDLANGAGISRPTCYIELRQMMRQGILVKGGKHRGKQLYKLNPKSPVVQAMQRAFKTLLAQAKKSKR